MNKYIQGTFIVIGVIALISFLVWGITYTKRTISNATVYEKLYSPRPGVECVRWVTADGVAGQCWKNADLPTHEIR